MKYNVSYILDDITHANLADANSPIAVAAWYKMRHPDALSMSDRQLRTTISSVNHVSEFP